ncbi:MAG: molybdopterin converting factor subunit 1 [Anaerolineae bacterium]
MHVTITFYGRLKADAGTRQARLELPGPTATIQDVVNAVTARYPAVATVLDTVAFTIGAVLVEPDAPVQDGDEVGFLPPVSGG